MNALALAEEIIAGRRLQRGDEELTVAFDARISKSSVRLRISSAKPIVKTRWISAPLLRQKRPLQRGLQVLRAVRTLEDRL